MFPHSDFDWIQRLFVDHSGDVSTCQSVLPVSHCITLNMFLQDFLWWVLLFPHDLFHYFKLCQMVLSHLLSLFCWLGKHLKGSQDGMVGVLLQCFLVVCCHPDQQTWLRL